MFLLLLFFTATLIIIKFGFNVSLVNQILQRIMELTDSVL